MAALRDEVCSTEVGVLAELGGLEKEFIVYGCAYQDGASIKYRVSTSAQEMNTFVQTAYRFHLWPTPVERLLYRAVVAEYAEEQLIESLRRQLACQIRDYYPKTFFEVLSPFALVEPVDLALPILKRLQTQQIGRFQKDELQLFAELVNEAAKQKLLCTTSQQELEQWIKGIQLQMADDMLAKARFQKTFYGFAHRFTQNKEHQCEQSLNFASIWQKHQYKKQAGELVTPIMSKTIWFAEYKELPQVWQQYVAWLNHLLSENLWDEIEQLQQLPAGVDADAYQELMQRMQNYLPAKSMQALYNYGRLWHVW